MSNGTPYDDMHFDIVIIGGGIVGSALACALGDSDLRIAIIEGRETPMAWPENGFDLRVSAITRASQYLFEQLGAWGAMRELRISPYREMHVWDATGKGSIHFDSAEIGEPDLGHIIENRVISRALAERLATFSNITLHCPASPKHLRLQASGGANLVLEDGTRLSSTLIIGADGANSWVRQQAGIEVDVRHYHQQAVVTTVKTGLPHHETAWQRFLPTGPLAFLPLTDDYSSIVWSTSPEQAGELLALDDSPFQEALAEALEHTLGEITEVGPRAAFPLQGQHVRQYVKPGLALIGDAAHTIHPLAGQGVNLGLADVASLAEILLTTQQTGKRLSNIKSLRRYERSRRSQNQLTLEAMGAFKQLFSNESTVLGTVRNLGLDMADQLPPLKHLLMRQAMGISRINTPR